MMMISCEKSGDIKESGDIALTDKRFEERLPSEYLV